MEAACPLIVFVVCIAGFCFAVWYQHAIATARQDYRKSLDRLKRDPHNADLKSRTLALGRRYARMATKNKPTEISLMNDINAATAGAGRNERVESGKLSPDGRAVTCPHCSMRVKFVSELSGDDVSCPHCDEEFRMPSGPAVSQGPSIEDRLANLDRLRAKNLISETEYQSRRQRILDDL